MNKKNETKKESSVQKKTPPKKRPATAKTAKTAKPAKTTQPTRTAKKVATPPPPPPKPKNATPVIPVKSYSLDFYHPLPLLKKLNSHRCLALDIDVDKIRYIVAKKSGDLIQIVTWGMQKFPPEITHRFRAMQVALESIKQKLYKAGTEVRVSVFSTEFMIKTDIMPFMKKKNDLERAIFYKYKNELKHFKLDKMYWGYDILQEFEDQGIKKVKLQMVFAPDETINRYIYIFEQLKLPVSQIIPRPAGLLAAYNVMVDNYKSDLLINISYDFTQICYIKGGNLEYIRNLGIGARNLEVSIRDDGTISPEDEQDLIKTDKKGEEQESILRKRLLEKLKDLKVKQNPVLHTFFSEILRSIAFIQGNDRKNFVDRVFLTGYGIQKESLLPYLKKRLNIPIFVIYPKFSDCPPEEQLKFGEYFTTVGTVLQKYQGFNLLPESFKEKIFYRKLSRWLYFIMFMFTIIAGYLTALQHKMLVAQKNLLEKRQQEYRVLNPYEESYNQVIKLIGEIQKENKALQSQVDQQPPIVQMMRLFSNLTPKEIRLNTFVFQNLLSDNKLVENADEENIAHYAITIEGEIKGDFVNGDVKLINFINSLDNLKFFKTINLEDKERDQFEKKISFAITLTF